jgi:hypothetical protein
VRIGSFSRCITDNGLDTCMTAGQINAAATRAKVEIFVPGNPLSGSWLRSPGLRAGRPQSPRAILNRSHKRGGNHRMYIYHLFYL